ncbi:hypothetical protein [Billgrantia lactosivorans]|nr:hypothetical protein [Halomonas lactosivorans]
MSDAQGYRAMAFPDDLQRLESRHEPKSGRIGQLYQVGASPSR